MDGRTELQKTYLVEISHSTHDVASYPILRWVVVGVTNEMAAMRAVMRSTTYIKPPYYDRVQVKELANIIDSSTVGVFRLNE